MMAAMDSNQKPQQRDDRSFSNGNAGPVTVSLMEGFVTQVAHWWLF